MAAVDSHVKCEKWIRDDDNYSEGSRARWWLNRLIGRRKRVKVEWPFPFVEEKLFVLTLSAGLEGYHINVDGKHVTSFPYRTVSIYPTLFLYDCVQMNGFIHAIHNSEDRRTSWLVILCYI